MKRMLEALLDRRDLSADRAEELLERLTDPELPPPLAGALLAALRAKGETADEIRGFATAMRRLAEKPAIPPGLPAVDIVGTGGDGSGSLNLSTGAALLVAACGVPVVKHGNRSVTSRSGSADVLERLELDLPADGEQAARCLASTGFTFLFAPHFHPAMAALAQVRRSLRVRTVFNLLGPLTNPAAPPYGVIGAYSEETAGRMAEALAGMAVRRVFVVHGAHGWDEATPCGPFTLFDVRSGSVRRTVRDPARYGFPRRPVRDLLGGDAFENALRIRDVFDGERGGHRDALVLGAGLALEVTGKTRSFAHARRLAEDAIDSGAARELLDALASFRNRPRAIREAGGG